MKSGLLLLIAMAAACMPPGHPTTHVYAGSRPPTTPTSQTVGAWFVDGSNTTGCANNANDCQSATCAGVLRGPCTSVGEIISRWSTSSPTTAQPTKILSLSDDNEPAFDLTPVIETGGRFTVSGSLTVVASGTLGTVVQKNRTTPQLLTANLGQLATPFVGFLLSDTTRGVYAWLDSATSGNVATLSQPFASIVDCATFPFESDTVIAGDAYQVLRPSKVPIRTWNPSFNTQSSFGSGTVCMENLWAPDSSGTPGNGVFQFNISAQVNQSRVDPTAYSRITNQRQEPAYHFNDFWNGGLQANAVTQNAPGIIGGDIYSSESLGGNIANNGSFILDGDVIAHGLVLYANLSGAIGAAYVKSAIIILNSTVRLSHNVAGPALWGPGFLRVGSNATLVYENATFAGAYSMTGGLFFGTASNVTTGSAYDVSVNPAVWHAGITLSAANIDAAIGSGGFGGAAIDPFLRTAITPER